eukprot:7560021-Pyramimonas_sp.AAC.1
MASKMAQYGPSWLKMASSDRRHVMTILCNRTGEGLDQVTTKARSPSRPERPSANRSVRGRTKAAP